MAEINELVEKLTEPQKEVWRLLVSGMTGREVAAARGTTTSAVRNLAQIIYAKMGVKSHEELILQNWSKPNE